MDLGYSRLLQLEGVQWTSVCRLVVVEEESYSEKLQEQEMKQNLSAIPGSLRMYVSVCQDHETLGQLQTKMQTEDSQSLCGYSETLHRRKLCYHQRSLWTAQANAVWHIFLFKTYNEHCSQISACKSEDTGQPEDVLVTFEEQSTGQKVTHENGCSLKGVHLYWSGKRQFIVFLICLVLEELHNMHPVESVHLSLCFRKLFTWSEKCEKWSSTGLE